MGIFNFLKRIIYKKQIVNSIENVESINEENEAKGIRPNIIKVSSDRSKNQFYLYDALRPDLKNNATVVGVSILPMRAIGEMGGGYPLGSTQQQAMALKQVVNSSIKYMNENSFKKVGKWIGTNSLILNPRAGRDINAYYDRMSLRFFYFGDPIRRKNVYACDSFSVVTHEFGHAFLDSLRPDWWDIQSLEIWSLHESFGDLTALLNALQYDQLINSALLETKNNLRQSNVISRLAGDMGIGLFNITKGSNGEPRNCLRDMVVPWNYVIPESLPQNGRDDVLLNECHSFSRVFTNACYEIIIRIYEDLIKNAKTTKNQALKSAANIFAKNLLKSVAVCPTSVRAFDALAKQMINEDSLLTGDKYKSIYSSVFSSRKILQRGVLMLNNEKFEDFKSKIKEEHEVQENSNGKTIITKEKKTLKLREKIEISALNNNPLVDLEIEVPNERTYYFNTDGILIDINGATEQEIINDAFSCLNYLNNNNKAGNQEDAWFEIKDNKLTRKQISCKCNKPNYCDPNAPEYGKPWKPANNSGCSTCYNKNCLPMSCDCQQTKEELPTKKGCYTKFKTCGGNSYKIGSIISRKVC
jgi:hypothetical protein